MLSRLRRWVAYRQHLTVLVRDAEDGGYRVSSVHDARLRIEARCRAGYATEQVGLSRLIKDHPAWKYDSGPGWIAALRPDCEPAVACCPGHLGGLLDRIELGKAGN